jgi:hypothetical protein
MREAVACGGGGGDEVEHDGTYGVAWRKRGHALAQSL